MHDRIGLVRVFSRLNVGGPSVHVLLLASGLRHFSCDTTLVLGRTAEHEGDMNYLAEMRGVQPVFIPSLGREISFVNDLFAIFALWSLLKKYRPLIVHTHTSKAGFCGRIAARMAGIPVIVHTFHGHVLQGYFGALKTRIFISLERFLGRWTDALVTVSQTVKDELVAHRIAAEDKFRVIELGLDLQPLLSSAGPSGVLRKHWNLSEGQPLVGIVGRLVPIKDHETFLLAAAEVRRRGCDAKFAVIGDGILRRTLEIRAAELGLGKNIRFFGWRRDLPEVYADLDAVALSSRNEGTPVSLIEATAAGKPVIATAVGGVPDFITNGWNGILVSPGDHLALAEGILSILANPAKAEAMATNGRSMVAGRFSISRLLNEHYNLYDSLLKKKGISCRRDDTKADG
jgi:glycosyltransferase involved in cell wall biosynthesis